jgi:plastocyanin domain-containing protein
MMLVNIAGFALIALIVWWFWLYKPSTVEADRDELVVVVDNGIYLPSNIRVAAGKATQLRFLRKDPSPCAETLLLPDLNISATLPLNRTRTIELPAMPAGEYEFHCQMKMYRGVLKAE